MPRGRRQGVAVGDVGRLVGVGDRFQIVETAVDEITQRIQCKKTAKGGTLEDVNIQHRSEDESLN